jgi:hypothetical protein
MNFRSGFSLRVKKSNYWRNLKFGGILNLHDHVQHTLQAQRCRDCGRWTQPCHTVPISHGSTAISEGIVSLLSGYLAYFHVIQYIYRSERRPHKLKYRPLCFVAQRQPLCWSFLYHSGIVLSVGGSVWYFVRNLCCTVTIDSSFGKFQDTERFLISCPRHISSDCPLAVKPASTPRRLLRKQTWRDSLPIDMLLSAVSVLVAAMPSSGVPEGLINGRV